MDKVSIKGREIRVEPLTFKESKDLTRIIGAHFAGDMEVLQQATKGGASAVDVIMGMPELATQMLALCLRIPPEDVDAATLTEVVDALMVVVVVNRLQENFAAIKNLVGLLQAPTQGPDAEAEMGKAAAEIRKRLASTRPRSLLSWLTGLVGPKRK